MSAIGDYIHLSYSGYVLQKGAKKTPYFRTYKRALMAREDAFNAWKDSQTSSILKQLEKEIQKNVDLLNSINKQNIDSTSKEQQEMAYALLDDMFEESPKYLTVDKIQAAAAGALTANAYRWGTNIGKKTNKTDIQTSVIYNINNQIQSYLNQNLDNINKEINNILKGDLTSLEKINSSVEATKISIQNFINKMNNQLKVATDSSQKKFEIQINKIFNKLIKAIQNNDKLSTNENILNILNNIASGIKMGTQEKQYKGDMFEILIGLTGTKMSALAGYEIEKSVVSGMEASKRGINTHYFKQGIDWNSVLQNDTFEKPYGDFIISASSVPNKVDIKIELKSGEHAYISAKNYSQKSIEGGFHNYTQSFLTLIQNENHENLINHFLNLNAIKSTSLEDSRVSMNDFIRRLTIAKLITGYNTVTGSNGESMDEANIFAVFNSDTGKVSFYNMKDILNGIFSQGKYKNMYIPTALFNANQKQSNYSTRINNILRCLNVRVSYSFNNTELPKK